MKLKHKIEYALVCASNGLTRLLPRKAVFSIYQAFAMLFFYAVKSRRNLTRKNLEIAFPEMTSEQRHSLAKATYKNIAHAMAYNALMMVKRISLEEMWSDMEVNPDASERFHAAQQKKGGLIIFTAHIGNWELLPQSLPLICKDKKLNMIARELDNPLLEQKLVRPFREQLGQRVIYKKNALIGTVKALKRNEIVGILIDQKVGPQDGGVEVDFFGRKIISLATSAQLQLKFDLPVLPVYVARQPNGRYRAYVDEAIDWVNNGKPHAEQVIELAGLHHKKVEEMIRAYPDQWFWMHNRWKLQKEEYR
jgi:Kdo2-lipid IVA lauroyltransferase/acyltransferase